MNLYLNQAHQNSSISLATNCLRLPAENLFLSSKIALKSNCKRIPADGVMRAQKRKYLTYWGDDTKKKCNEHRKSFQKRSITLSIAIF